MADLLSTQSCYPVSVPRTGRKDDYGDPEVGRRLKVFRQQEELTQDALAAIWRTAGAGKPNRDVVGAYEAGRRSIPMDQLQVLAKKFKNLDLNWLLVGRGAAPTAGGLSAKMAELEHRVQSLEELPIIQAVFTRIEDHYERMRDAMGIPDKPHTPPPDQSPGPENA